MWISGAGRETLVARCRRWAQLPHTPRAPALRRTSRTWEMTSCPFEGHRAVTHQVGAGEVGGQARRLPPFSHRAHHFEADYTRTRQFNCSLCPKLPATALEPGAAPLSLRPAAAEQLLARQPPRRLLPDKSNRDDFLVNKCGAWASAGFLPEHGPLIGLGMHGMRQQAARRPSNRELLPACAERVVFRAAAMRARVASMLRSRTSCLMGTGKHIIQTITAHKRIGVWAARRSSGRAAHTN